VAKASAVSLKPKKVSVAKASAVASTDHVT
jgi:hypothetical protein